MHLWCIFIKSPYFMSNSTKNDILTKFIFAKWPIGCRLAYKGKNTYMYGVRNLEMTIRFSLKSRPSERFHRPEMSQIKAEISLRTNVKLIFHKNVGLQ